MIYVSNNAGLNGVYRTQGIRPLKVFSSLYSLKVNIKN